MLLIKSTNRNTVFVFENEMFIHGSMSKYERRKSLIGSV